MAKLQKSNRQNTSNTTNTQGGSFSPQYTDRKSKIYNVPEMELDLLSFANELRTAFFSIATFFAGVIVNCLISSSATNDIYKNISIILFVVFLILGIVAWIYRSNIVKNIKRESTLK